MELTVHERRQQDSKNRHKLMILSSWQMFSIEEKMVMGQRRVRQETLWFKLVWTLTQNWGKGEERWSVTQSSGGHASTGK